MIPALEGSPVYLDYNSTTPVDLQVTEAMRPYLADWFGNPSSSHVYGAEPQRALAHARIQVAALIGADATEIVFTGSGSEADNLALRGVVLAAKTDRPHVITQVTEHPGILETCHALERLHRTEVTYLPVDRDGLVDPAALAAALTERTVLVSVMAANNETGALQPIPELARITHAHGALFHCDAAQAAGKIPLDVRDLGVDLMTLVGHKMYAPKGIAALYVRHGVALEPLIYGGGQERGLRSGTENVALTALPGCRRPTRRAGAGRRRRTAHRRTARPTPHRPDRPAPRPYPSERPRRTAPAQHPQHQHRRHPRSRTPRRRTRDRRLHRLGLPQRRPPALPGTERHGPARDPQSRRAPPVPRPLDHCRRHRPDRRAARTGSELMAAETTGKSMKGELPRHLRSIAQILPR